MKLKKILSSVLALTALSTSLCPIGIKAAEPTLTITLDAGHGINSEGDGTGTNGAVAFGGKNEVYYNWEIANHCKDRLEEYGVRVYMAKKSVEHDPSFDDRVIPASKNGSVAFISIHNNYSDNANARGTQIYTVNPNYNKEMYNNTMKLANRIMSRLNKDAGTVKNADPYYVNSKTNSQHPDGSLQEYYGVLWRAKRYSEGKIRGSKLMAGMIVECAFLSNKQDVEQLMLKEDKLKAIGYAIADGIADHYKLTLLSEMTQEVTEEQTQTPTEDTDEAMTDISSDSVTDGVAEGGGNNVIWIVMAAVIVVLIGGAVVFLAIKKSKS